MLVCVDASTDCFLRPFDIFAELEACQIKLQAISADTTSVGSASDMPDAVSMNGESLGLNYNFNLPSFFVQSTSTTERTILSVSCWKIEISRPN